jgi:peptide/nickel transport system substrate-binding protein
MNKLKALIMGALLMVASVSSSSASNTFTWAGPAEVPTLDPHGTALSTAITIYSQIYEPLVRNIGGKGLFPALATEWKAVAKDQWRFTIRQNVKFHDGTAFTADDVVFSLERVRAEGSDLREYLDMVRDVVKVDDHTVDVFTKDPVANLPVRMAMFPMMSKAWSIAHGIEKPSKAMQGEQSYANFNANGTGPFKLTLRRLDDRTELEVNPNYWDKPKHNLDKLVFRPIKDASTRAAALLTGEVDLIDSVPVQDVERLSRDPKIAVSKIGEWRNVYFGMDMGRGTLNGGGPDEKNPFKDVRVRKALFHAIDVEAIKTRILRGLSEPSAMPVAVTVDGYNAAADKRPAYNLDEGKRLLAAAGYPNGFKVDLDCPNDRWVADVQICTAVVSMLARIGIQVNLIAQPSSLF